MRTLYFLSCAFFLLLSVFFFSLAYSQPSQIGCLPYFHTWCGLSANLGCRSETCCKRLAENRGRKKSPQVRHLGTIEQLCQARPYIFATKARIDNRTKLVKEQYFFHMPLQYCELRPITGWDQLASLGHPCKFQQGSLLAVLLHTPVVGVSQTLRRWTEGATYIRQGGHHVWHWNTF